MGFFTSFSKPLFAGNTHHYLGSLVGQRVVQDPQSKLPHPHDPRYPLRLTYLYGATVLADTYQKAGVGQESREIAIFTGHPSMRRGLTKEQLAEQTLVVPAREFFLERRWHGLYPRLWLGQWLAKAKTSLPNQPSSPSTP